VSRRQLLKVRRAGIGTAAVIRHVVRQVIVKISRPEGWSA